MKNSPTLTVPQVAKLLGVTIPYAQRLLREGKIPGWKTSQGWRTTREAVEEYKVAREKAARARKRKG